MIVQLAVVTITWHIEQVAVKILSKVGTAQKKNQNSAKHFKLNYHD
jgi:hypothetical protein